jgi:hypothetical protein
MDFNEYVCAALIRERRRELEAEAHRRSLARATRPRRRWRAALGTALVRAGGWLLREDAVRLSA